MLRGNHRASIDDKGRLKLPAAFRHSIEAKYGTELFVTSYDGESVWICPLPEWEKIEARLAELPVVDQHKMRLMYRTNFYGKQASMDPQGRILIHPDLRESAQLNREVCVIGLLSRLDVWNPQRLLDRDRTGYYSEEDAVAIAKLGI